MINVCYIVLHSPYLLTQLVSRSAYKCPVTSCAKSFIVRSNAKHHTNAWRPFGSTCRGCFNFWSRFFVSAHRQGPSARSSQTLLATSFQSYFNSAAQFSALPEAFSYSPMTLPAPASGTSGHPLLRKEVLEKHRVASAEEELPYFITIF